MKVSRRSWTFLSRTELIIFTASARRAEQEDGSNIFNQLEKGDQVEENDENVKVEKMMKTKGRIQKPQS